MKTLDLNTVLIITAIATNIVAVGRAFVKINVKLAVMENNVRHIMNKMGMEVRKEDDISGE